MIRSIVPQDNCILLPARRVLIQQLNELTKEQSDHIAVGCCMRQREPYLTLCVQGGNHRQSRCDGVKAAVANTALASPQLPDEIGFVQPSFVYVYDPLALFQQLENRLGILLSLNQDTNRVGIRMQLFRLHISVAHIEFKDSPHLLCCHLEVIGVIDRFDNHVGVD